MFRITSIFVSAIGLVGLGANVTSAQLVPLWPKEKLFKESDLIVIAEAISTKNTKDRVVDERWQDFKLAVIHTTFRPAHFVKGDKKLKKLVLLHFRMGEDIGKQPEVREIVNGPSFIEFQKEPKAPGKPLVAHFQGKKYPGPKYLLFLKKRKDGKYEFVTGRLFPQLSIHVWQKPLPLASPSKRDKK